MELASEVVVEFGVISLLPDSVAVLGPTGGILVVLGGILQEVPGGFLVLVPGGVASYFWDVGGDAGEQLSAAVVRVPNGAVSSPQGGPVQVRRHLSLRRALQPLQSSPVLSALRPVSPSAMAPSASSPLFPA